MARDQGFTLVELLFTLAVVAIALSIAAPSFSEMLSKQRASTATHELRSALDFARETAAHSGQSISLVANNGDWAAGWEIFVDADNRGIRPPEQAPLAVHAALTGISIRTDSTSRRFIHFTPQGNAIQPNGAFHAGSLTLCGEGRSSFRVVFNKAGRIRSETGTTNDLCPR